MTDAEKSVLERDAVAMGLPSASRSEAISFVGKMLVDAGHVEPGYVESMLTREETVSTFLGNGVAMPHGTFEGKEAVRSTGIVIAQYPGGVDWGAGDAHLVIGLAAVGDDHINVLSHIADVLQDETLAEKLWTTEDQDFLYSTLNVPLEEDGDDVGEASQSLDITIGGGTGLHARPASMIVECANGFDGEVLIEKGDRSAKGNSIMGLLALGAVAGDQVTVTASGGTSDASQKATKEIERILTTPESEL